MCGGIDVLLAAQYGRKRIKIPQIERPIHIHSLVAKSSHKSVYEPTLDEAFLSQLRVCVLTWVRSHDAVERGMLEN